VELSGEWPVPHKKVVISHFEVLSVVGQSSKLAFLQQSIENFIAVPIPKHLLTRRSIQHDQNGAELCGQWPVPHKKVVINHFEVLSVVGQSSKLSYLQQSIENFIAMAIPKNLLTRRSIQHDQLGCN